MVATLKTDKQVDVYYNNVINPRVASLLNELSGSSNKAAPSLISAASVTDSLQKISGLSNILTKDRDPQGLEGSIRITNLEKLSQQYPFVSLTMGSDSSLFSLTLRRDTAPQIVSSFTTEVQDYLDALMAPIVTGENLSTSEYLALLSSVYGKTIAQEIEHSHISLEIHVPGRITSVFGGVGTGNKAIFNIPLVDFLVLQKPQVYQIAWK